MDKLTKKEEKEIKKWIGDYFVNVIMFICKLIGYRIFVEFKMDGQKDKTFSINVNFPYRCVTLYIRPAGVELYRAKNYQGIRATLFHEAFHIMHWNYKEYSNARFVHEETMDEMEEDLADLFSIIVDDLYVATQKKNAPKKSKRKKAKKIQEIPHNRGDDLADLI